MSVGNKGSRIESLHLLFQLEEIIPVPRQEALPAARPHVAMHAMAHVAVVSHELPIRGGGGAGIQLGDDADVEISLSSGQREGALPYGCHDVSSFSSSRR